jgi:hypothetical protein
MRSAALALFMTGLAICALACSSGLSDSVGPDNVGSTPDATAETLHEMHTKPDPDQRVTETDVLAPELEGAESLAEANTETGFPECLPGDGCFLDPCTENGQCQSGWCVDLLGEGVCTTACQEECPPGWSCQQVAGTEPDVVFICVSAYANLCRPCNSGADCSSTGGAEDVCVLYPGEGSFCGGACDADTACPTGFACQEAITTDGVATSQCLALGGTCACSKKAIVLALWTSCQLENEWGLCEGKRVCLEDGLSACDAVLPAAETCNGLDDDCDSATDEETCDDLNSCSLDTCLGPQGCAHEPIHGGECLDGNSCTVGDHCEQGVCTGAKVNCDDLNFCTDDSCNDTGGCLFEPNSLPCDDGDPCTVADECEAGQCQGYEVACDCQADEDCIPLDDGNPCTGTLFCDKGKLPYSCKTAPGSVVECPAPEGEDLFCKKNVCDPKTGKCELVPDHEGNLCDDQDPCTLADTCSDGTCQPGGPANCSDDNPCTDDACGPAGCTHVSNAAPCDDSDLCTVGETCSDGLCQPGLPIGCNDQNPCTDDVCDPGLGCLHTAAAGPCDDGNPCTSGETCSKGKCWPAVALDCDDDNVCTDDGCDPAGGCTHKLNTAPCDDADLCTTGDHCHLNTCIGSAKLTCNDGNACTDDSCNPKSGCTFVPNLAPCEDGNLCTAGDSCSGGWCIFQSLVVCDDGLVCNGDETCQPKSGCVAGPPPLLNDGVACTFDFCDEAAGGPVHSPQDGACDDGKLCNGAEVCDLKAGCLPGVPIVVDDGVSCTLDACVESAPGAFVEHKPNDLACDDMSVCTGTEKCHSTQGCQPGIPLVCTDGNVCTDDSCDPVAGCQFLPNQLPCPGGLCQGGACVCQPACQGKQCGGDGCGGACGTCPANQQCSQGQCVPIVQAHLLLTDHAENRIFKLSLSGQVLAAFNSPVSGVQGVAHDRREKGKFWVTSTSQVMTFYQLDLQNGSLLKTLPNSGWGIKNNDIRGFTYFLASNAGDDLLIANSLNVNTIDVTNGNFKASGAGNFQTSFHKGDFLSGYWGVAQKGEYMERWATNHKTDTLEHWNSSTFISSFNLPLSEPRGVDLDPSGNFWVVDAATKKIYKLANGGQVLDSWAAPGTDPRDISYAAE